MTTRYKIMTLDACVSTITDLKKLDNKIVFTNGCFDILHLGHITYLEQAKDLGDILVVGLNSDASVSRLKGVGRPIKEEKTRAALLAGMAAVDMVVIFAEDTPIDTIRSIVPDVLVKGGDYSRNDIVGAEFVTSTGGQVTTIPFVEGYSSTDIIDRM